MAHAIMLIAMLALSLAGCAADGGEAFTVAAFSATIASPAKADAAAVAAPKGFKTIKGKVTETMSSADYTYVLVDDGNAKIWAAGPETPVAVGDEVVLADGAPMVNFSSKTLNRTFDVVYFVGKIDVVNGRSASGRAASPHGAAAPPAAAAPVDVSNVAKAEGGYRVAEIYAEKDALSGKEILVRAKVVKVNNGVMGKNWLHLRDGSGDAQTNDLTVTTNADAAVGDTVLARGKLGVAKDFGYGYKYAIIVEDAAVTRE